MVVVVAVVVVVDVVVIVIVIVVDVFASRCFPHDLHVKEEQMKLL